MKTEQILAAATQVRTGWLRSRYTDGAGNYCMNGALAVQIDPCLKGVSTPVTQGQFLLFEATVRQEYRLDRALRTAIELAFAVRKGLLTDKQLRQLDNFQQKHAKDVDAETPGFMPCMLNLYVCKSGNDASTLLREIAEHHRMLIS